MRDFFFSLYLTRLDLVVHHDLLLDQPLSLRVLQRALVCHGNLTTRTQKFCFY
jgi:hypothetical protein